MEVQALEVEKMFDNLTFKDMDPWRKTQSLVSNVKLLVLGTCNLKQIFDNDHEN